MISLIITIYLFPSFFPAKLVFSSYANLHKLLSDADQQLLGSITESQKQQQQSLTLDSRIISAAFLKKNLQNNSVKLPVVKITFQHLSQQAESETVERFCVFWDLREENWSDEGCTLIKTNQTHTDCSCNHLTHFALLATHSDSQDSALVGTGLDFGRIQAKDQTKEALNDNTSTVITLEIATYLVSSVCLLILVIVVVQVRLFFLLFKGS